jgi:hypothetical protein
VTGREGAVASPAYGLSLSARLDAIRQSRASAVIPARVVLAGFELCLPCTEAVTKAAGGVTKQLRVCASCKAAVKHRLQADRRGP